MATNEYIQFRLIHMPCCHILICWVNPRRPNYCPECGARIFHLFPREQWEAQWSEAWLRIQDYDKAIYSFGETEKHSKPSEKTA
jgi:hypothetical protein